MKLSEAVLVAGILSSVSGSIALLAPAFLAEASAGPIVVAAAVDTPRSPAGVVALAGGRDVVGEQALLAELVRTLQSGAAAKMAR